VASDLINNADKAENDVAYNLQGEDSEKAHTAHFSNDS
jgi:hypothetical protein